MREVFEIYVQSHFSAAHFLKGYDGDCARTHGHNWIIEVYVRCGELNEIGIGIDFRDIKNKVKSVLKDLDHCHLNDLTAFKDQNPTSENIARYLFKKLSAELNTKTAAISRIKVSETPGAGAFYWEEQE